ncbi:MAG: hypothetical protein R3B36_06865 [Polyangiaceae bacterium]
MSDARRPHKPLTCRTVALLAAALVLSTSALARADGPDPRAVEHFEAGVKLRDQGKTSGAIAEFEASLAAEPSVGAHLNLGNLFAGTDAARAYRHYVEALRLAEARNDDRVKDVKDATDALLGRAPHVRLSVTDAVAGTPGLEVRVDGVVVPREAFAAPVFCRRAGEHTLEVRADGREPNVVRVGDRTLVAVVLGPATAAPQGPAVAPPPGDTDRAPPTYWTGQRVLGAGVAGLGAIALGVGAVLGVSTLAKDSEITDKQRTAPPEAQQGLRDERRDLKDGPALASTISFIAGGALLAGGAALFFTAPSGSSRGDAVRFAPYASPGGAGMGVSGRF